MASFIVGHMRAHWTEFSHLIVFSCTNVSSTGRNKLKAEKRLVSVRSVHVSVLKMVIKQIVLISHERIVDVFVLKLMFFHRVCEGVPLLI